jgi:vanillate O-demethylase ferredoxin subunit
MHSQLSWSTATVQSVTDITPTVREFVLMPAAAGEAVRTYTPGAHLQVELLLQGRPQTRSYSLVGLPNASGYRIAVKRVEHSRGGSHAMWRLAVGDRLRISTPVDQFAASQQASATLLVAGGIGVTPLVGMAQQLAPRATPLRMLLAARTTAELAYAEPLRGLLGTRLHTLASDQGQHVDFAAEIAALPADAQMVVCGPSGMLEAARLAWAQAGRPAADLRFETFGNSGRLPAQAFEVRVAPQGLALQVPADGSLLEALEMAGVPMLSNCRKGECGLCATNVLSLDGEIDHRDVFLSPHEKQANERICVCVSRVVGCITLDSAYRPEKTAIPT